jgi:hypothetical protein
MKARRAGIGSRLDRIGGELENMNGIMAEMLALMPRPEGRLARGLNLSAAAVGVLGIAAVIDAVRNWFGG